MLDYQKLGALIGSAWRDRHPGATEGEIEEGRVKLVGVLCIDWKESDLEFYSALDYTMQGRCFGCGTDVEVGRDADGVLCCEICVGR